MAWEYRLPTALAIGLFWILSLGIDSSLRSGNSKSPMLSECFKLFTLCTLLLLAPAFAQADPSAQEGSWPHSAPQLGLFQRRPTFGLGVTRQLEGLLVQHESLTGERAMIVVEPWMDGPAKLTAEERATELAEQWKLDTSRRGMGALLVLQESAPGKVKIGYHPAVGLSKTQVAGDEDLRQLEDSIADWASSGSWDDIAEASAVWLLQSLKSPLLERPELLNFQDKANRQKAESKSQPTIADRSRGTDWLLGAPVVIFIVLGALFLVLESIRQGVRPQILLGAQRVIRFGIQDQLKDLARKGFKSSTRNQDNDISILSIEGQS